VTLAYVATTAAFLYVVPASEARDPVSFARRAGEAVLGPKGPIVLAAVVVLSAGVSVASLFVMAPRMYAAMAADGALPAFLGAERTRRGTLLLVTLSTALVLAGSFRQIVFFFMGTTVVFVAAAAAALFVLRRREPESPGFRTPGYPLVPALFLALLFAVVALVVVAQPVPVLAGAAAVLAAAAIRALGRRSGRVAR
jgi:amino acid transporter